MCMKKLLSFLMVILAAAGVSSCGKSELLAYYDIELNTLIRVLDMPSPEVRRVYDKVQDDVYEFSKKEELKMWEVWVPEDNLQKYDKKALKRFHAVLSEFKELEKSCREQAEAVPATEDGYFTLRFSLSLVQKSPSFVTGEVESYEFEVTSRK